MSTRDRADVPPTLIRVAAWSWRLLVVAAGLALVGFIALELRIVVVPVFLALLAATTLVPPVRWLRARGWPPLLATWAVFLVAGIQVTALLLALVPAVASQLEDVGVRVAEGLEGLEASLASGPFAVSPEQFDRLFDAVIGQAQANLSVITEGLLSGAFLAIEVVAGAFLALALTFFFVKDGDQMTDYVLDRLPAARRDLARALSVGGRGRRLAPTCEARPWWESSTPS